MTDTLEISVVVPTYNRLDTLRYVIPSLVAQDLRADAFEVIVADSNSNDGTAEYLAEIARASPNIRHLPGPYTGRASARNAGIAAARAPIVLFTDADIIASPDLLACHLARHAKAPAGR
jgi:glycosyltransferase involved in cell wall biosynthesis